NEFWKYPTSIFFLKNKGNSSFDKEMRDFLIKLMAFLFAKFIDSPSINAIKDDIYNACITVDKNNIFERQFKMEDDKFREKIDEQSSARLMRPLLLLDAYLNKSQKGLIKNTFDIEHIFPKKWQTSNYNGWDEKDAQDYLDRFGNKIVFEKKLNIQAGNGYFEKKKEKYKESEIAVIKELAAYPKSDWVKEDITKREIEFKNRIVKFLNENLTLVQE
ncbi:MAG: HNH endonuclease family protein, partial [Bacteroidetes bacterium]|nr:HNH endonuclease family protein [Bacteroidota bacterium]